MAHVLQLEPRSAGEGFGHRIVRAFEAGVRDRDLEVQRAGRCRDCLIEAAAVGSAL
jgi:hypothetical protein